MATGERPVEVGREVDHLMHDGVARPRPLLARGAVGVRVERVDGDGATTDRPDLCSARRRSTRTTRRRSTGCRRSRTVTRVHRHVRRRVDEHAATAVVVERLERAARAVERERDLARRARWASGRPLPSRNSAACHRDDRARRALGVDDERARRDALDAPRARRVLRHQRRRSASATRSAGRRTARSDTSAARARPDSPTLWASRLTTRRPADLGGLPVGAAARRRRWSRVPRPEMPPPCLARPVRRGATPATCGVADDQPVVAELRFEHERAARHVVSNGGGGKYHGLARRTS